jgi:uncharacterized repeat protein (TIGR01451 family)
MKKLLLLSAIFFCFGIFNSASAQVSTMPYTVALDSFGTITGTTLDAPMADDNYYANIPIGFNFDFAGSTHTTMVVSCNGYIQLDTLPTNMFSNFLNGTFNNRIAAFAADLMHKNSNASLQYVTVGTAPNRTCIIQWSNYSYFSGTTGSVSFQIRLFETSNCISFVYGANTYSSNPLQTQIGLRGTSSADYLVLGDSTCNWATAYPYPTINTQFPVSTSCSMPSGFAFHFGSCATAPGIQFSYITGKVYNDANGNASMDPSESPIANHIVQVNAGANYISTDGNGDYTYFFVDSTLTYSFASAPNTYWTSTTPANFTVTPSSQPCSGNDFGMQMIPNVHEVSIHCPSWGVKPAQVEPMPISYSNNGTTTESDTITFVMDSLYAFVSANPAPLAVNGQTITWVYPPLAPGQSGSIMLTLMPDSSGMLGNYMNSTLTIGPIADTVPTNNIVNLHQLISLAWDPNEKLAEPSGKIKAGTEINYTIHFQNTGTAAASYVTVRDTLDSNLDLMSFEVNGASHPMNFTMSGNGIATFTFYNIQLPDSGSNFAGSNGYVSYRVKTKANLAPTTIINNRAGIIFDWNPVVMTNTTSDTIDFVLGIHQQNNTEYVISANPNPSNGHVVFRFADNSFSEAELKVYANDGRLVYQQLKLHANESLDLSHLAPGVYSAVLLTDSKQQTVKIVRQ